ncbi:hypothetical protein FACS1894109_12250 [Spirochaetia bacterium]|nr:hypothetical protein FACS1894109_12250 [Spirochaetia bacterium]
MGKAEFGMLDAILDELVKSWNDNEYQPLLEADVAGWLFHIMISAKDFYNSKKEEIHLETRVTNQPQVKPDIVIGEVNQNPEGQRICIDPRVVIEIKLFPSKGFTNSQHFVHLEHVLEDDLPKLKLILEENRKCLCYSLIIDGDSYLEKEFKKGKYESTTTRWQIINERNNSNKNIVLYFIKFSGNRWSWERV